MPLNAGAVMQTKWLYKPSPAKQNNEISHGIKED
jgi:hypothetical protein